MQPIDFSPIANAPLQAMQAAAYGDAMQANRLQNRLVQMAATEDHRKKSAAGLIAGALYGPQQQAAPTNQLAAPAPTATPAAAPSAMDPLLAFQKQGNPQAATLYGDMAQVPGGTQPTPATPDAAPTAPADPYTAQRTRLRDLYNAGQITAEDAQAADQQITAAEQAARSTRSTPKLAFYKDLMGKAAEAGDNETFQALAKQAQIDPDVKGMIPDTTTLQVTGKQQLEVTRPFTAEELAGLAAKHPELGINPNTPPGMYKLTTKGGKPVGWEVKEPKEPVGVEGAYLDGLKAQIRAKNPSWDPKRVEFEAAKQVRAENQAAGRENKQFTFNLKNSGGSDEADGFRSYSPEMKEQAFKDRQLGTYKYPTGMKSLSEKQAFDKEYYKWRVDGKINATDVTTDRAVAAANKTALSELTKREQLITTFTRRIDATSDVALAAYKRFGNTDSRLRNVPINKLKGYIGDGELQAIKLAVKSLSNEIAKVESGSIGIGEVSVEQAKYMEKVHDVNLSLEDFVKVVNMGKELGKTSTETLKLQREDLVKEMRGAGKGANDTPAIPHYQSAVNRVVKTMTGKWDNLSSKKSMWNTLKQAGYSDAQALKIYDDARGKQP
jgi:hypothetical protein